jgi:putative DNA primase/helicase
MAFKLNSLTDETPVLQLPVVIPHDEIIASLEAKVVTIDFQEIAFPGYNKLKKKKEALEAAAGDADSVNSDIYDKIVKQLKGMKLNYKHYIIHTIEELLKLAEKNDWGLCKSDSFIYLYNGASWAVFDKADLTTFLSNAAYKMGIKKADAKFHKFAEELYKPKVKRQKSTTLINLQNGTFEITPKGNILREFRRSDFVKYQLPFAYDPNATAPQFFKFINKVLPDIEKQTVLAEYLGYVFIQPSVLKLEKTLFNYGSGANGKSVFFEISTALLGEENVSNYALQGLTDKTGYNRAKLANTLVNYASEINGSLESSYFKQLVSGEPVEARLPYGEPFILKDYAKLIFNGNTLPKEVEHTNAYFRRFLIIPWEVNIPESEQDKDLAKNIIATELPGIFNWVLEGLHRILKQREFSKCDAADEMLKSYKLESDTVALFLTDSYYEQDNFSYLSLTELLKQYVSYCISNGYKPVSNRVLSERLKALNYRVLRKNIGTVVFIKRNSVASEASEDPTKQLF